MEEAKKLLFPLRVTYENQIKEFLQEIESHYIKELA